ncbi:MAG: hypothetical protein ACI9G9_000532 [Psychromonas sp.]|jgi:hypothetical protein
MKKVILTLIVTLMSVLVSAQIGSAKSLSKEKVYESVGKGNVFFFLPASITESQVNESAEYYTMYFSVKYNAKENSVVLTFVDEEEKNKHVMVRFFVSLGIEEIKMEQKTYSPEEFYETFVRLD